MFPKHKYNATKTKVGDLKFDSKLEARIYQEMLVIPEIQILELQPKFVLQEKFTDLMGKNHREIAYFADFRIQFHGKEIILDCKGMETPVFALKEKMLLYKKLPFEFLKVKSLKDLKTQLNLI